METKVKLQPGETLKLVSSETKGSMSEMDVSTYSIVSATGVVVGSVVHKDHTAIKGFRRSQSVIQKDASGAVIVDEQW